MEFEIQEGKGFVKEYDYYDNLKYEGEYLYGKWNGKGKEYSHQYHNFIENQLIFEGEYLNGIRNGKGKEYYDGKLRYDGEYLNGIKNGKGKEFYDYDKIKFEGEYFNGKKWRGNEYNIDGKIDFEIKNGNKK